MATQTPDNSASENESRFGYRQVLPVLSGSFAEFFETNYFAKQPGIFSHFLKKKFPAQSSWQFDYSDYVPPVLLEATLISDKFFNEFKLIRDYMIRPPPKKMFTMKNGGESIILTEKFMIHIKDGAKNTKQMVVAFIGEEAENTSYNVVKAECDKTKFEEFEAGAEGHFSYYLKNRKSIPDDDPLKNDLRVVTRKAASTINLDDFGSDYPFVVYNPTEDNKVYVCLFTKEELKNGDSGKRKQRNDKYQQVVSSNFYQNVSFEVTVTPETKYYDALYETKTSKDSFFRFLRRKLGTEQNSSVVLSDVENDKTSGFFNSEPLKQLSDLLFQLYQVPIWQYRPISMLSASDNDRTGLLGNFKSFTEKAKSTAAYLTGFTEKSKYWLPGEKYTGTLKNTEKLTVTKQYLDTFGKKAFIDKKSKFGSQEKENNFILVSRYLLAEHSRYLVRLVLAFTGKRVTTVRPVRSKYGLEYITRVNDFQITDTMRVFIEHYLSDKVHLDSEHSSRDGVLTPSSLRQLVNALLKQGGTTHLNNPLIGFAVDWDLNFNRYNLRQNLLIPNAYLCSLLPKQSEEEDYAMIDEFLTYSLFLKSAQVSNTNNISSKLQQLLNRESEKWITKRGIELTDVQFKILKDQLLQKYRFLQYTGDTSDPSSSSSWKLVLYVASSLKRKEKMEKIEKLSIKDSDYKDFLTYKDEIKQLETSAQTIPIRTFTLNLYDKKLYVFFAFKKMKGMKRIIDLMSFGNNVFRETGKTVLFQLMKTQKDEKPYLSLYDATSIIDNKSRDLVDKLTFNMKSSIIGGNLISFSLYKLLSNDYLDTKIHMLRSVNHGDLFLSVQEKKTKCRYGMKLSEGKWRVWDDMEGSEFRKFLKVTEVLEQGNEQTCTFYEPQQTSNGQFFSAYDVGTFKGIKFVKSGENTFKIRHISENLKNALKTFTNGSKVNENDTYKMNELQNQLFNFQSEKFTFQGQIKERKVLDESGQEIDFDITMITDNEQVKKAVDKIDDDSEMRNEYVPAGENPLVKDSTGDNDSTITENKIVDEKNEKKEQVVAEEETSDGVYGSGSFTKKSRKRRKIKFTQKRKRIGIGAPGKTTFRNTTSGRKIYK
jgi:hypothetical protein